MNVKLTGSERVLGTILISFSRAAHHGKSKKFKDFLASSPILINSSKRNLIKQERKKNSSVQFTLKLSTLINHQVVNLIS